MQNPAGCRQNWYDVRYDVSLWSCDGLDVVWSVAVHPKHSRFAQTLALQIGEADRRAPAERSASQSAGRVDTPVSKHCSCVISLIKQNIRVCYSIKLAHKGPIEHLYEEEEVTHRELAIEQATHPQTGDCNATHFRVVVLHRWKHLKATNEKRLSAGHIRKVLAIYQSFDYCIEECTCTRT